MKNFFKLSFFMLLSMMVLFSCEKEDQSVAENGTLEFSFSKNALQQTNQRVAVDAAHSILITIEDSNGKTVVNRKKVALYNFNDEYISEPVALTVGDYYLVEFLVLNENDEIIYATPKENSKLDYLVAQPLPIALHVVHDETTKTIPQVISVENVAAEDFGYSTFSFDIVETFDFLVSVFRYDTAVENFQLTNANLKIKASGETLYDGQVEDSTNQIRVPAQYPNYDLEISKNGYLTVVKSLTNAQLRDYLGTPLEIILLPEKNILVGIVDGKLVSIDRASGDATTLMAIDSLPDDLQIKTLTFGNNRFYFINKPSSSPELYQISLDGLASKVGDLTYNGNQLQLCEAVAFNHYDGELYISASLGGGVNVDDFYTETIMKVNTTNGNCEVTADFDNGEIAPDIDAMSFSDSIFYSFDGAPPGQNFAKFYRSNFNLVDGNILNAIYSSSYVDVTDLSVVGDQLYFLVDRQLRLIDLNNNISYLIGETHSAAEYHGNIIEGMTSIE